MRFQLLVRITFFGFERVFCKACNSSDGQIMDPTVVWPSVQGILVPWIDWKTVSLTIPRHYRSIYGSEVPRGCRKRRIILPTVLLCWWYGTVLLVLPLGPFRNLLPKDRSCADGKYSPLRTHIWLKSRSASRTESICALGPLWKYFCSRRRTEIFFLFSLIIHRKEGDVFVRILSLSSEGPLSCVT